MLIFGGVLQDPDSCHADATKRQKKNVISFFIMPRFSLFYSSSLFFFFLAFRSLFIGESYVCGMVVFCCCCCTEAMQMLCYWQTAYVSCLCFDPTIRWVRLLWFPLSLFLPSQFFLYLLQSISCICCYALDKNAVEVEWITLLARTQQIVRNFGIAASCLP